MNEENKEEPKCSEKDDMFARTNEGSGYMQCQKHIQNSAFCNRSKEEPNYSHLSHTHCWDNKLRVCHIPMNEHKQCCLCDLKKEEPMEWEEEFDKLVSTKIEYERDTYHGELGIPTGHEKKTIEIMAKHPSIKSFIKNLHQSSIDKAVREDRDRIVKEIEFFDWQEYHNCPYPIENEKCYCSEQTKIKVINIINPNISSPSEEGN